MTKNQTNSVKPKALRFAWGKANRREAFSKQMFQEDLHSGVLPYHLRRGENEVVAVSGEVDELHKVSVLCDSLGRGRSYSVERSVEDAITEIALRISYYGVALFERVGGWENIPLTMYSFGSEHVWSGPGFLLQIVPRERWSYTKQKFAIIPSNDVWRIRMPYQLGSPRKYRALLDTLSAWPELGPPFLQSDLDEGRFPRNFAIEDYRRLIRTHQYRATREWGWATRDWSLDYVTEFYQLYRLLTFRWCQALLGEHIVLELNRLLVEYDIKARIELRNVATADAILDVRDKLKIGKIGFSAINEVLGLKTR